MSGVRRQAKVIQPKVIKDNNEWKAEVRNIVQDLCSRGLNVSNVPSFNNTYTGESREIHPFEKSLSALKNETKKRLTELLAIDDRFQLVDSVSTALHDFKNKVQQLRSSYQAELASQYLLYNNALKQSPLVEKINFLLGSKDIEKKDSEKGKGKINTIKMAQEVVKEALSSLVGIDRSPVSIKLTIDEKKGSLKYEILNPGDSNKDAIIVSIDELEALQKNLPEILKELGQGGEIKTMSISANDAIGAVDHLIVDINNLKNKTPICSQLDKLSEKQPLLKKFIENLKNDLSNNNVFEVNEFLVTQVSKLSNYENNQDIKYFLNYIDDRPEFFSEATKSSLEQARADINPQKFIKHYDQNLLNHINTKDPAFNGTIAVQIVSLSENLKIVKEALRSGSPEVLQAKDQVMALREQLTNVIRFLNSEGSFCQDVKSTFIEAKKILNKMEQNNNPLAACEYKDSAPAQLSSPLSGAKPAVPNNNSYSSARQLVEEKYATLEIRSAKI